MAEYIEREAVMQKFADHVRWSNNSDFAPVPTWNQAVQIVEDSPAADVRSVARGKWELDSDKLPICSNCGEIALQRIFVKLPHLIQDVRMVKSNFCPNCGADMREGS